MNRFSELLSDRNIIFDIQSDNKLDILSEMVRFGVKNEIISESKRDIILDALMNREKSMSTGIGSGIAIPHCSIEGLVEPLCLMGVSKKGIEFDSIDHKPVFIIVMLVAPKDKFQDHIKTLALIAKTLNQESIRNQVVNAGSYEDLVKII